MEVDWKRIEERWDKTQTLTEKQIIQKEKNKDIQGEKNICIMVIAIEKRIKEIFENFIFDYKIEFYITFRALNERAIWIYEEFKMLNLDLVKKDIKQKIRNIKVYKMGCEAFWDIFLKWQKKQNDYSKYE